MGIPKPKKLFFFDDKEEIMKRQLVVLEKVESLKGVLFAPDYSPAMQQVTEQAWEEVLKSAKKMRLASSKKDWKYMRDDLYNVWKIQTMKKIAAVRTTGVQVGVAAVLEETLNEVDFKILDIICTITTKTDSDDSFIQKDTIQNAERTKYKQSETFWERVTQRKIITTMKKHKVARDPMTMELLKHEMFLRKRTTDLVKSTSYQCIRFPQAKEKTLWEKFLSLF